MRAITTRRRSTATHFIPPSGISAMEMTGTNPLESLIRPSTRRACCDRLREVLIFLAIGSADRLDRPELLAGSSDLALDHIGLAEILANLRIVRIERDRFQIIADPLVHPTELARRIAAIIERLR